MSEKVLLLSIDNINIGVLRLDMNLLFNAPREDKKALSVN